MSVYVYLSIYLSIYLYIYIHGIILYWESLDDIRINGYASNDSPVFQGYDSCFQPLVLVSQQLTLKGGVLW